jgi:hypothetical protein
MILRRAVAVAIASLCAAGLVSTTASGARLRVVGIVSQPVVSDGVRYAVIPGPGAQLSVFDDATGRTMHVRTPADCVAQHVPVAAVGGGAIMWDQCDGAAATVLDIASGTLSHYEPVAGGTPNSYVDIRFTALGRKWLAYVHTGYDAPDATFYLNRFNGSVRSGPSDLHLAADLDSAGLFRRLCWGLQRVYRPDAYPLSSNPPFVLDGEFAVVDSSGYTGLPQGLLLEQCHRAHRLLAQVSTQQIGGGLITWAEGDVYPPTYAKVLDLHRMRQRSYTIPPNIETYGPATTAHTRHRLYTSVLLYGPSFSPQYAISTVRIDAIG